MAELTELGVREALDHFGIEYTPKGEGELRVLCPFHADTNPSCDINEEQRVYNCLACHAHGDVISFLAGAMKTKRSVILHELGMATGATEVGQDVVERLHQALVVHAVAKGILATKGITDATIREYRLGFNATNKRITIPIFDDRGRVVNVRQYKVGDKHKVINWRGLGERRLYPVEALRQATVYLTEGELKALLLRQHGFNAVTATGGANTWTQEWVTSFKGRHVVIVYDIDVAGVAGADRIARALFTTAATVKVVALPIDKSEYPKGDVTNYFVDLNHTPEDFAQLVAGTPVWKPPLLRKDEVPTEVLSLHLSQSSLAKYHNKFVETEVVISAKDTAPYIIPAKLEVRCDRGGSDLCVACPVASFEAGQTIDLGATNQTILELVGVNVDRQDQVLKKAAGIPRRCSSCLFRAVESMNVEELRLIPQLTMSTSETDHVVRRAFYVGHGVETNTAYVLRSKVVPEPQTQYATLLTYEAKASADSLTTFKLTEELRHGLRVFQPERWDLDSLTQHLAGLYDDLEANVTHIYQRPSLHCFYDLVYHSVLHIPFQGTLVKGWVEGLVIGDSGQGKSETIKRLMDHYRVGEKVDSKGASVAGLLGGLQETAKRWFVSWGIITLNDRRLVVLEEVKGMAQEVIAKLTDMRSSGIAEVSKVEKARTTARTRLIWISNPRTDRQVMSYNFGVETIKELIGALEDIRRFDMAIVVASGEVDEGLLNMATSARPKREHLFTSKLCHQLVLWAWSRKPEQVSLTPEAIEAILAEARRMGKEYSATIPLVESADQRLKLLRLSAACAARTFSTDDGETLVVRPCHVQYVAKFLDTVYSAPALGYQQYSKALLGERDLLDADEVERVVKDLPHAADAVNALLESKSMSPVDVMDWTELDKDAARSFVGFLVRKNALKRGRRGYHKTPAFISLLRELAKSALNNAPKVEEF